MNLNCLAIIDMQNAFMNEYTAHLPGRIRQFLETHDFDSVIATKYCNTPGTACYRLGGWKDCMKNTPDAELVPELQPFVQRVFEKTTFSGLTYECRAFLKEQQFEKIWFCGVNTDCCVLATMLNCYDTGQDCAVIADLCASTVGIPAHEHALNLIRDNMTSERVIHSSAL